MWLYVTMPNLQGGPQFARDNIKERPGDPPTRLGERRRSGLKFHLKLHGREVPEDDLRFLTQTDREELLHAHEQQSSHELGETEPPKQEGHQQRELRSWTKR